MKKRGWMKRAGKTLAALFTGATLAFSPAAQPVAEASLWGDVAGGIIGTSMIYNYCLDGILKLGNDPGQQKMMLDKDMQERGEDTDPQDNALVNEVMNQLIERGNYAMASNSLPFRWRVNNNDSFNAACSAMNYVSINKGLLKALNYNRDQMAGVLAHEIVHGLHQHVAYDGAKAVAIQVGSAFLLQGRDDILTGLLAGVILNYNQAKNISVPSENDADRSGFYLMASAGFNPGGFPAMICKMPESPGENILFPDDHPETSKRMKRALGWLKTYGIDHVTVEDATVSIDGRPLLTAIPQEAYSAKEMACFIAGGLAKAFHDNSMAATWSFRPAPGGKMDFLNDDDVYRYLKDAVQQRGLVSELENMVKAAYNSERENGNREKIMEEEQKRLDKIARKRAKAQRNNEENIATYQRKAEQYNAMRLPELALHEANRLLICDPESVVGHSQKGRAYHQQENYEAALGEYDFVAQAMPNDSLNLLRRAFAYQALGNDEAALADCKRVEQLAPGHFADIHLVTGLVYERRGDEEAALREFTKAASLTTRSAIEIPESYLLRLNELVSGVTAK